jgi:hypothetical protein
VLIPAPRIAALQSEVFGTSSHTHDVICATPIMTFVKPEGNSLYIRKDLCALSVSSVWEIVFETSPGVLQFDLKSCCYGVK